MSDRAKEAGAGGAQPRTEHEREALRLLDAAVQATGGQHRAGQREMVLQVARALESRRHLLVQAGTGTGKSLAYLIPALQHAMTQEDPVVVATATLALQAQIMKRDAPRLVEALKDELPREPVVALVKGRSNYLCRHKVDGGYPGDEGEEALFTVADDGGSSGRLRSELDVVPPGDLRMALAALASDSPHGRLWATIIQHRFGGSGALAGHPIGNLMLAGLNEVLADPVAALDELGRILGVKGRVLPMCPVGLGIEADVVGLESDPRVSRSIRGQVAIATTVGKVRRVRLLPADPPATHQAIDAIMNADLIVLGPGSWFTSVIPHVLVPQLLTALQTTTARRALVLNLVAEPGETAGFSVERHIHVLAQHAPGFTVDDIVVDSARVPSDREREQLRRTAAILDAHVQFADVSRPGTPLHDPARLAAALEGVRKRGAPPSATAQQTRPTPRAKPTPTGNGPRGDDPWR